MELGKEGISETSSDESDRQERFNEEVTAGTASSTRRSYGCSFCKRGFTNAQALGGHMNIHRKDRAKVKQQVMTTSPPRNSSSLSSNEYITKINLMHPVSKKTERTNCYQGFEVQRHYDDLSYFQPPHGYHHERRDIDYVNPIRSSSSSMSLRRTNEELWGANLSLRFVSNNEVINKNVSEEDDDDNDDVDLELRLGHDP